ncbi:Argininosuccinate lyase [Variovorax sp. PBS-H4]|uniref:Bug family tripartite tricarboxylate transporter substrate binding protein n=1 Tax=Variovorax sp. PBS-H4 TaxID=434008 RepID=UPI0013176C0B|nr:tripartite tricarboxylate transporter substrate binding protein [Variovorax sp. PBS-H4]VTU40303.1 Argininosuccinate lyase [Variovorax sp. PBS-H4]
MNRRNMIAGSIASMLGTQLHAEGSHDYPRRPVTLIFPFPAGSPGDAEVREIGNSMHEATGQPLVIDYRPGASGTIGTQLAQRAAPDGYTLLYGSTTSIVTGPAVIMKSPYSGTADFEPVTGIGRIDGVLIVPANSKYRTAQELAEALKANPGKLNYGTIGPGSMSHLIGEIYLRTVGAKATPVAYKGTPQAVQALIAGEIDFLSDSVASSGGLIDGGKVRALAVATNERLSQLPDVPTLTETGLKLVLGVWLGLFAPKGTPRPVLDQWALYASNYLRDADVRSKLLARGIEPTPSTPQEFARQVAADEAQWRPLIKSLNIQT